MSLTRRELLKGTAAALAVAGGAGAAAPAAAVGAVAGKAIATGAAAAAAGPRPDGPGSAALKLWYPRPATQWVEALPLGNGRLGAMVWGGGRSERLQLNEDTLYAGQPYDPTPPEALAALPEVRRLLFAGRYAEAEALANAKMMGQPKKQMPYQPLGDLLLDFLEISELNGYRRELDLDRALATSTFEARGIQHTREVFVSAVDQCVAMRLSGDKPRRIGLRIGLGSDHAQAAVEVYVSRLRGKLEPHGVALRSIRGFGYRLEILAP